MNRRNFLRKAIWVPPLFAIGRARGQTLTFTGPVVVGSINQTVAPACTLLASQTTANDYSSGTVQSQKIQNSVAATVCKVVVRYSNTGLSRTVNVSFRSAENNGGTQYGDASDAFTVAGSSAEQNYEPAWAGGYPTLPAGDFFLTCVANASGARCHQGLIAGGTYYGGTTYYKWNDATAQTTTDMYFEIWTMQ